MTSANPPKPGDTFDLDGELVEVTVVNREEHTVCGIVLATLDSFGNFDWSSPDLTDGVGVAIMPR